MAPDSADLPIGRTVQVRAFPLDETGAFLAGQDAEWRTEDPGVATVDADGVATGVAVGTTEIVATLGAFEGRALLVVDRAPELALSGDSLAFDAAAGQGDPPPRTVDITNAGAFPLVGLSIDSVLYGDGASDWLAAELDQAAAPATLTLTPMADQVTAAGDYLATVWLSGLDADNSPASVRAVLQMGSGPATTLAITAGDGQSATVGTAVPTAPTILVTDAFDNTVPGAEVTFTVTGGNGSVNGGVVLTDGSGAASVGGWTLGTTAGPNVLTAEVAGAAPVEFTATGLVGPADGLELIEGDNQSAVAGFAVPVPPAVRVVDEYGNGVEGVEVTFAVASGGGSVTGEAQTSGADGSAAAEAWTLGTTAGINTLDASVEELGAMVTFTATALSGAAEELVLMAGDAQVDTAAATLPVAYAVQVLDINDNGVPNVPVSWQITSGDDGSAPSTSITDGSGVATAVRVLGTGAGTQTVRAEVGGIPPVDFTATATAATPAVLVAVTTTSQSATVNTNVSSPPEVAVQDMFGNPIGGHQVTFAVTLGGGSTSPTTPVVTAADGTVGVSFWKVGTNAGFFSDRLTATADGVGLSGNPRTFFATATAGSPSSISIYSGNGQTAVTGNYVSSFPTVIVRDQYSNPVPSVGITFNASGSGFEGTHNATTNSAGRASTSWRLSTGGHSMNSSGRYPNTLTASVDGYFLFTQFTGYAIYSYEDHIHPLWSSQGCTGCHTGAGTSGLTLSGTAAQTRAELVNVITVCGGGAISDSYKRVAPGSESLSILLRLVDPDLGFVGGCNSRMPNASGMSSTSIERIRAWIRNGAPNN